MKNCLINAEVQQLLVPQVITETTSTSLFDASGINGSIDLMINIGAVSLDADNRYAITLTHSDATAAGGFTAVSASDVLIQDVSVFNAAGQASKAYRISVNPRKRYLRATFTETGTATLAIAVTGIGAAMRSAPDAATAVGTAAT